MKKVKEIIESFSKNNCFSFVNHHVLKCYNIRVTTISLAIRIFLLMSRTVTRQADETKQNEVLSYTITAKLTTVANNSPILRKEDEVTVLISNAVFFTFTEVSLTFSNKW